ncbi:HisA/HisF-related TIM barrel protein [[Eubacterium] cellulosolvens]
MTFLEIPAISLMDKTIVIVHEENYETLTIDNQVPDALDLIEIITENYNTIYLMDINGLTLGNPQLEVVREISDFCEVWLDAGIADSEGVYDLLVAGAQEVVLATKTLKDFFELAKTYELTENLIFELDYDGEVISPGIQLMDMSPEKLGDEILNIGINRMIFGDLGRIGTNKPLESDLIRALVQQGLELYVGGGVKLTDVPTLKKLGAQGAIIELTDILKHGQVNF